MKYIFSFFLTLLSFQLFLQTPSIESIKELESLKLGEQIKEESDFIDIQTSTVKTEEDECEFDEKCIYGYELFNKTPTTFALSTDTPVPADYILGPGDQIKIEYFGNESISEAIYINRSGFIKLPLLGPVNFAGLTLLDAQDVIKQIVSKSLIGTEVILTLGNLRSINVYLLGEAFKPGSYTVGSLSSLTNVLFASGGVSKLGSLRNIELKRQGKVVKKYDFYDLLFSGDTSTDIRLQDGDTIFIPLIKKRVAMNGSVMREGYFEIKDSDSFLDLISLAGLKSQQSNILEYNTFNPESQERISKFLNISETQDLSLQDGDVLNILANNASVINTIRLEGEFKFPGVYSLEEGDTLLDLINKAGGITSYAYTEGAVFTRESIAKIEKESYLKNADNLENSLITSASDAAIDGIGYEAILSLIDKLRSIDPIGRQVIIADPFLLKSDPQLNFQLQDGDKLFIPRRTESISVVGEVLSPISHVYNSDLSIDDYLTLSGGLSDGADRNRIFIVGPNGQATLYSNRLFGTNISETLLPGSTIVVSRDPQPFDWLKLSGVITPIFSDLAIAAASISAISNN
jgi:protein involved in polysaccharide export with SLBB domain